MTTEDQGDGQFDQSYFDDHSIYGRYANSSATELESWYESLLRGIEHLIGPVVPGGSKVFDVGCGFGPTLEVIRIRDCDVIGTDLAYYALARARGLGVPLVQASAIDLPVRDEAFDVVTSFEMLEHVPNPLRALDELIRVLKRGGTLLATTPNPFSSLLPVYDAWSDDTHVSVMSPHRWAKALRDASLVDVRVVPVLNPPLVWRYSRHIRAVRFPIFGPTSVLVGRRP